ncbi:hypothetical protein [Magnetococcus sp. PR-3]|uniref:hypothetical protein n=1 Tax=Magnetococcus sp. PR-3 TaxID=3120355 RepID=UPI002FCE0E2D
MKALIQVRWVGPKQVNGSPSAGTEPHTAVLKTMDAKLKGYGHRERVVVKRNYGLSGVDIDTVKANRSPSLGTVTVMFQREAGYDADRQDWFRANHKKQMEAYI